jgi:hypothetical protein
MNPVAGGRKISFGCSIIRAISMDTKERAKKTQKNLKKIDLSDGNGSGNISNLSISGVCSTCKYEDKLYLERLLYFL